MKPLGFAIADHRSSRMAADPPNYKKYGVPLYGAAWAPRHIPSKPPQAQQMDRKEDDDVSANENIAADNYLVLAGGGGEGRSGIPNAVLLSRFDFSNNSLSQQPVGKLGLGSELPYRIAVHPLGEGIICALPKSCKWLEWQVVQDSNICELDLKTSETVFKEFEDIGQQLAVAFNSDGSMIAVGGEDGKLRVFKWPSMRIILDQTDVHTSVKALDFSPDGKFLASTGSGGPCRVWDVTSSSAVASLPKEKDEVFGFCKFSQNNEDNQVLYTTVMKGQGQSIVIWDSTSWKKIRTKQIGRDPISAFNVSTDGRILAAGTIQGDVSIIESASMHVRTVVRKAHLGLVTTLAFSPCSRALVSTSMDSSVRVTQILEEKKNGLSSWIVVILVILLAVAAYFLKTDGLLLN